jgi:hypothetical protein
MNPSEDYKRLLEDKGIPLLDLGLREIALERDDALQAVKLLQKASVPILGGDVYFRRKSGIESAYANWHSDQAPSEGRDCYVTRSCLKTENYIKKFSSPDSPMLFVLVIDG